MSNLDLQIGHLTVEQQEFLKDLLVKHSDMFALNTGDNTPHLLFPDNHQVSIRILD